MASLAREQGAVRAGRSAQRHAAARAGVKSWKWRAREADACDHGRGCALRFWYDVAMHLVGDVVSVQASRGLWLRYRVSGSNVHTLV